MVYELCMEMKERPFIYHHPIVFMIEGAKAFCVSYAKCGGELYDLVINNGSIFNIMSNELVQALIEEPA